MARLIDTSVFVGLERDGKTLYALQTVVSDAPFALASITASELLLGIYQALPSDQRERRMTFVESVLNGVQVLPFDLAVARTHARLIAQLAAVGKLIGSNDMIIAATALTHGYVVLTHNLRHFERVPGLVVNAPAW